MGWCKVRLVKLYYEDGVTFIMSPPKPRIPTGTPRGDWSVVPIKGWSLRPEA
jgi:hypothetical protein